jgi:SLT domain-containing protein
MAAGIRYAMMRYGSLDEVPGVKAKQKGHHYKGF